MSWKPRKLLEIQVFFSFLESSRKICLPGRLVFLGGKLGHLKFHLSASHSTSLNVEEKPTGENKALVLVRSN